MRAESLRAYSVCESVSFEIIHRFPVGKAPGETNPQKAAHIAQAKHTQCPKRIVHDALHGIHLIIGAWCSRDLGRIEP